LEEHVKEVLQAEEVAKMDRIAEMEATRAQNIIAHADEIHARPQREWFASKKQKETTKQTAAEKHQMMQDIAGTGTHRMSRKKRRAREAREASGANPQDDTAAGDGDDGKPPKKSKTVTERGIKAVARTQKKKKGLQEKELTGRSVHEEDRLLEQQQQKRKQQQQQSSKIKRKGAFASDAAGDSSLFEDEKVAFSKKKTSKEEDKERPAPSRYVLKRITGGGIILCMHDEF
jgi:ATP-dependent RNA helicase DDX27